MGFWWNWKNRFAILQFCNLGICITLCVFTNQQNILDKTIFLHHPQNMPPMKVGVWSEESGGLLGWKPGFTQRKPQGHHKGLKRAALRLPKVLVNNVDFWRKKRSSALRREALEIRVIEQQTLKFLPGWTRQNVGEVALCEFHSAHWR